MKRTLITLLSLFSVVPLGLAQMAAPRPLDIQRGDIEKIKDAGTAAIENVLEDFIRKRGGDSLKSFAILPLTEDLEGGYFTEKFQSVLADKGRAAGYRLYTREDADIGKLLNEIRWGENFGDTMDQATIQKFGDIKGVQAVIIPRMSVTRIDGVITVRASIKGNEVTTFANLPGCGETKQVVEPPKPMITKKTLWQKIVENANAFAAIIIILAIALPVLYFILRAFHNARRPR
jgi:hypothetical protein